MMKTVVAIGILTTAVALMVAGTAQAAPRTIFELNHYRCYSVNQDRVDRFVPLTIEVADQFIEKSPQTPKTRMITLIRPVLLCVPTDKLGPPPHETDIDEAGLHYMCYDTTERPAVSRFEVEVENQFTQGRMNPDDKQHLTVIRSASLFCVPSTKRVLNP